MFVSCLRNVLYLDIVEAVKTIEHKFKLCMLSEMEHLLWTVFCWLREKKTPQQNLMQQQLPMSNFIYFSCRCGTYGTYKQFIKNFDAGKMAKDKENKKKMNDNWMTLSFYVTLVRWVDGFCWTIWKEKYLPFGLLLHLKNESNW